MIYKVELGDGSCQKTFMSMMIFVYRKNYLCHQSETEMFDDVLIYTT